MCMHLKQQRMRHYLVELQGKMAATTFHSEEIPWTAEPGRLQSMGSQSGQLSYFTFTFTGNNRQIQYYHHKPFFSVIGTDQMERKISKDKS